MKMMSMVSEWIDNLYDWAEEETNKAKKKVKLFIAGFVDGWEYGCLAIGNVVCIAGAIVGIVGLFKKKK